MGANISRIEVVASWCHRQTPCISMNLWRAYASRCLSRFAPTSEQLFVYIDRVPLDAKGIPVAITRLQRKMIEVTGILASFVNKERENLEVLTLLGTAQRNLSDLIAQGLPNPSVVSLDELSKALKEATAEGTRLRFIVKEFEHHSTRMLALLEWLIQERDILAQRGTAQTVSKRLRETEESASSSKKQQVSVEEVSLLEAFTTGVVDQKKEISSIQELHGLSQRDRGRQRRSASSSTQQRVSVEEVSLLEAFTTGVVDQKKEISSIQELHRLSQRDRGR